MPRTESTRLPQKDSRDRERLNALLDEVRLAHVAMVADGHPLVVPTALVRDGDRVLIHGSTGSTWMRRLAEGIDASVAVTGLDGVVVARSVFESSFHYRSAVLFGRFTPLAEKRGALDAVAEGLVPGRAAEVRASTSRELSATLVLSMPIDAWSLRVSDGWPEDEDDDIAGTAWAGVVPVHTVYGDPVPAPDLRHGIAVPASVRSLAGHE